MYRDSVTTVFQLRPGYSASTSDGIVTGLIVRLRGTHEGPFSTPDVLALDPSDFSMQSAVKSVAVFGWSQASALVPADERHSYSEVSASSLDKLPVYSFHMDSLIDIRT